VGLWRSGCSCPAIFNNSHCGLFSHLSHRQACTTLDNATATRATEDVALVPSCPSGNGTIYVDNDSIAYVGRYSSDNSAAFINSVQVKIGGCTQCFSDCSGSRIDNAWRVVRRQVGRQLHVLQQNRSASNVNYPKPAQTQSLRALGILYHVGRIQTHDCVRQITLRVLRKV
jgi:hypothetical protein